MVTRKSRPVGGHRTIGNCAILFVSLAACTNLLGIDDARVDPTITGGLGPGVVGGGSGAGGASLEGGPDAHGGHTGGSMPGDGSVPTADAGGDGDTISPVCKSYCDDIMSFCVDQVKQYMDLKQCQKSCVLFAEGGVTDPDGNTASCRLKYAGKARYAAGTERDAYCRKAGPGSDGTCGTVCDGFCSLMMPTCTVQKTAPYFFASTADCLTACRSLRDAPPYTVSDGELPDRNDAQCRLFHVGSAVMDADEHCEHAMGVTMCDRKIDGGD